MGKPVAFNAHKPMVAMASGALLAKATFTRAGYPGLRSGWLLKAYGFCWTDPRARAPNRISGRAHPEYLLVRSKREARRFIQSIERLVHRHEI